MSAPQGLGYTPERLPAAARQYLSRDRVGAQEDRARLWEPGALLNQGGLAACVGFAWTAEFMAEPAADHRATTAIGNKYARNHYHRARYLAGWYGPGNYPSEGVSMMRGAQVAVERGLIDEYLWAQSINDIRDAVVGVGPVVLGIPWLRTLGNVSRGGLTRPAGRSRGKHALLVTGYDPAKRIPGIPGEHRMFRLRNSWGTVWGRPTKPRKDYPRSGTAWIHERDLEKLVSTDDFYDTACLPIGRHPVDLAELLEKHPDPTVS